MNLKRCVHGHFYDGDKYAVCPKCGGAEKPAAARVRQEEKVVQGQPEEPERSREPVVGWLVCTEGRFYGRIYELKAGENRIGGSPDQDIVLALDDQVAKCCQIRVTYDPEKRVFYADMGEARELSYVNGQVLLMGLELGNRDILQVGDTKLMFIPLCGPDFAWKEPQNKLTDKES